MRTTLLITGLAGLLAISTLPAAAAGPGHDAPGARGSGEYVLTDGDSGWRSDNNPRYGQPSPDYDWQNRRDGASNWFGWPFVEGYRHDNRQQYQHDNRRQMSDNDIRHRLTQQNYRDFNHGNFNNGYYIVNATDYRGRDVRLTVDAFSGYLINVQRRDR